MELSEYSTILETLAAKLVTLSRVGRETRQWLPPPSKVPRTNQILISLSSPWGTDEFLGLQSHV